MSEFPCVPLILDRKTPGQVHVVLGSLQCQIDFLIEIVGGTAVHQIVVDRLEDAPVIEALQGTVPTVFLLRRPTALSLAADTRAKVGVWNAAVLRRDSAAVRTLVRHGAALVEVQGLTSERVDQIGNMALDALGEDAAPSSLMWECAWHATGTEKAARPAWVDPWDSPWAWAKGELPLQVRLHVLYKDLVGYVFIKDKDIKQAASMGISQRRIEMLGALHLDARRVERAITLLSKWRTRNDPNKAVQVALQLSCAFAA